MRVWVKDGGRLELRWSIGQERQYDGRYTYIVNDEIVIAKVGYYDRKQK